MANGYPKGSFIVTATTPAGKSVDKTVPYVRVPNFNAVRNFGVAVNNLTDNTLNRVSVKLERTLVEFNNGSASWATADVPYLYFDTTLESVTVRRVQNQAGFYATTIFTVQADDTNCVALIAENLYRVVIPVTCDNTMLSPFIGACYDAYTETPLKTSIAFCQEFNTTNYKLVATFDTHDTSIGIPLYYETTNTWEVATQEIQGIDYNVGKIAIQLKGVNDNG